MMLYDDIPTQKVLNFILVDAFEASGADSIEEWLGEGKTLAELAGRELSTEFYQARMDDLVLIEHIWGLNEIEAELNDTQGPRAVHVSNRGQGELLFLPAHPNGTAWFTTDIFQREREAFKATP